VPKKCLRLQYFVSRDFSLRLLVETDETETDETDESTDESKVID